MALDSYTAAFLGLMQAAFPDIGGSVLDAEQARRIHARASFPGGPDLLSVEDRGVGGAPGVRVRIYRPHGDGVPLRPVVYLHGGGWVLCGLDSHDGVCRQLADRAGVLVIAVDYRLSPAARFPAAGDDVETVLRWTAQHAAELGADPDLLTVAGDSAGGALAAAACLRARDAGGPRIAFQLLVYPVTDCLAERSDAVEQSLLTARHMRWFVRQYLRRPEDGLRPYASPLRAADLSGLPPCLLIVAEHDPLRAEGEAYARRLARDGVAVAAYLANGTFHGLFGMGALLPAARPAEAIAAAGLRGGLAAARAAAAAAGPGAIARLRTSEDSPEPGVERDWWSQADTLSHSERTLDEPRIG